MPIFVVKISSLESKLVYLIRAESAVKAIEIVNNTYVIETNMAIECFCADGSNFVNV